jgi:molybdate transport system regulatory protein
MPRLSIRIDFAPERRIGPGKVALLEQIDSTGSIAGGGRALGMSYRRAWLLVDELNTLFGSPVLETRAGGSGGGTAVLTPIGRTLVQEYRAMEKAATSATRRHIDRLTRKISSRR